MHTLSSVFIYILCELNLNLFFLDAVVKQDQKKKKALQKYFSLMNVHYS